MIVFKFVSISEIKENLTVAEKRKHIRNMKKKIPTIRLR